MEKDIEYYRRQFFEEARDILESVNSDLLKAESDPHNSELVNSIFRGIHTIKGSAGVFDFDAISSFAHHLENLVGVVRDGRLELEPEVVDMLLSGCDTLQEMLKGCECGLPTVGDDALVERIKSCVSRCDNGGHPDVQPPRQTGISEGMPLLRLPEEVSARIGKAVSGGLKAYEVTLRYANDAYVNGYDPSVFLRNIRGCCSEYHPVSDETPIPELSGFDPSILYLHPVLYVATDMEADEISSYALEPQFVIVKPITMEDRGRAAREEIWENAEKVERSMFEEFIIPAREGLEAIEGALLKYEREACQASLNEVFRVVHTIKGDADYLGLTNLVRFVHDLESILEGLKSNQYSANRRTTDVVLRAIDDLKGIVAGLREQKGPVSLTDAYHRVKQHLLVLNTEHHPETTKDEMPSLDEEVGSTFMDQARQYKEILDAFRRNESQDPLARQALRRALKGISSASKFVGIETLSILAGRALDSPESDDPTFLMNTIDEITAFIRGLTDERKKIGELLVEDGKLSSQDVEEALSCQKSIGEILVESGKVSRGEVAQALRKQQFMDAGQRLRPEAEKQAEVTTMRVDERKIEEFSKMIGELVIARNTYDYLLHQLAASGDQSRHVKAFKDNLHLLSRLTNEMQMGVTSMRMVPVKGIFQKFQRVVRDISRKQKKEIQMITHGDETEVDKKVADMLSDPLIHLVRNSCDHGIEPADERKKAGKPGAGTVILKASQEGRHLIIKVIDDGRGLNRKRIFEKAKAMGVAVNSPEDEDLFNHIFLAGLSTKTEVSDISGRGVGMDVVMSTVRSLGGDVHVMSEEGTGTDITLRIPMAMGIMTALMVESAGKQYALPMESILGTTKVRADQVSRLMNGFGTFYRGELLPVESLSALLTGTDSDRGNRHTETSKAGDPSDEMPIAVLKTNRGKVGLSVDRLNRNAEIAVKPVPPQLASIGAISGVSIMGDGQVVLVLNPDGLV